MSTNPTPQQPTTPNTLRIGLCQISTTPNKALNLEVAERSVKEAVQQHGAQLVVLPEVFNSPYDNSAFPLYQESIPALHTTHTAIMELDGVESQTTKFLSNLAKELNVFIVGGSIPERGAEGKIYNTSCTYNNSGDLVAKHRKMHLFDIDIPGKVTFRESDSLSPGDAVTTFQYPTALLPNKTPEFRAALTIGVGICYDIRFAEYALAARQIHNADALIYPGAFTTVTGEAHWQILQQARALDNQLYVAACSPARCDPADPVNVCEKTGKAYTYQAWGHSSVVSPWAKVLAMAKDKPEVVIADLDFNEMDDIRQRVPISKQRRNDVYKVQQF